MKKILFILLVLLSTLGFSQNPNWSGYTNDYGSHKFKFYSTRAHYTSLDTVWTPTSQKTGDVWWDNSKKTLSIQTSNTMVRKLITDDNISYYIKQPIATSVDNSLLKTVGTSGRAVEQTGVTIDDANIVSAPTFSATDLTDGYIPYHISDALGQGNSVMFNNSTFGRIGINTASPSTTLHLSSTSATPSENTDIAVITFTRNTTGAKGPQIAAYREAGDYDYQGLRFRVHNNYDHTVSSIDAMTINKDGNTGIGCTSPTSKLSVLGTAATNLNLFNYVNADINKFRTTFANATDSSSTSLTSTSTGNLTLKITNKAGNIQFKSDSTLTTAPTFSATNLSDGYIPYHVSDILGFANSGLSWDGIDKLSLNSTQIVRMPDQTTFAGSLIIGNGGNNLTRTTGDEGRCNTFIGLLAGYANTTGYRNIFTGYLAGFANTTGRHNVFTGSSAGYANTTGYHNVFTGYLAGFANTTGRYNVFTGSSAGRYIADGVTANQTSNNSVFIGSNTKALSDGNTNQIVIGSDATGKGSNTVVLGNTSIVGTYLQGNVGISCNSPTSKLSVLGTAATNLNLFNFVNGDINKLRTTFADATDTSSTHLSYTSTGSPEFHIVGKGGSTLFKVDSVSTTFLGTYSGIYVADASTAQAIATGTTYTKSTAFTTNGSSSNCTADAANDKITVTKTGHYLVNCPVSFSGESPNVNWKMAAFLGGVEQPQIHVQRKIGTGGDVGSTTCTGIINVASVPVDVDIRFRHDQAGSENITVVYSNLTVTYIGE